MNVCSLVGRIARDIDIKYTDGNGQQLAVVKTSIAINRFGKKNEADFINLVFFGKTAELANKYLYKGAQVGVQGHIQSGKYTNKNGVTVYTTDVIVEKMDLIDWGKEQKQDNPPAEEVPEGFSALAEDVPF